MSMRETPRGDAQFDLFVPYLSDLALKDQKDTMERPFFALGKRKRLKPIDYTSPDGTVWVKVEAMPAHGMATIWDADILIWAATVLTDMKNRGVNDLPRTLHVHPYDLLKSIRREPKGGEHYERLRASLERLTSTTITTNIRADTKKKVAMFHWLDGYKEKIDPETGQSEGMEILLSDWLYSGIVGQGGVLQIHPDYFLLTGGFERWLYRAVRKHVGAKEAGMNMAVPMLYEKSGCDDQPRKFKAAIKAICHADNLPEYHLEWIERTEGGDAAIYAIRRDLLPTDHAAFRFKARRSKNRPRQLAD